MDTAVLDTAEPYVFWYFHQRLNWHILRSGTSYTSSIRNNWDYFRCLNTYTGLTIDKTSGDFIGSYWSTALTVEAKSWHLWCYRNCRPCRRQVLGWNTNLLLSSGFNMSLCHRGNSGCWCNLTPTTLSLTTTSYSPTVTATDNKDTYPTNHSLSKHFLCSHSYQDWKCTCNSYNIALKP
jgi:hypothetical protein